MTFEVLVHPVAFIVYQPTIHDPKVGDNGLALTVFVLLPHPLGRVQCLPVLVVRGTKVVTTWLLGYR